MDQVLEGTGKTIQIHTTRERQQRWLVNSRSCERILNAMTTRTVNNMPAHLGWAHKMSSQHHTGNWRLAAKDVIEMLLMPSIIVDGYPGELSTRPEFRVMELHQLYFDFIAPFWEEDRLNPSKQLKRTYKYVESEVDNLIDKRNESRLLRKASKRGMLSLSTWLSI
eukprot:scaffold4659_cov73-Attheya_sp.AAC.2